MEPNVLIARVLTSVAAGLLTLFGQPVLAAGPVQQPAPIQDQREVGRSEADGHEQRLNEIDQLIHDGRYTDAETGARDALIAIDAAGEGGSYEAALVADHLVEALLQGGKGTRSETLARAKMAIQIKNSWLGPTSVESARSLERLGRVLTRREAFQDAKRALENSLRILEATLGPGTADVARTRQSIGKLLFEQGDYDSAKQWLEQSLAIQEIALGPDTNDVASTLLILGDCYVYQDDLEAAKVQLGRSVHLYETSLGPHHANVAISLTSLGQALRRNGEVVEARATLERAVAIFEGSQLAESPMAATALGILGSVLTDTGDYAVAGPLLDRALGIRIREYGPNHSAVARTLNQCGTLRALMGNHTAAAELFAQAAQIMETIHGPTSPALAMVLGNWGLALAGMGRYVEAEALMIRSLAIDVRNLGADNPQIAQSLADLSTSVYEPMGDYQKATESARRSLVILEATVDPNDFRLLYALNSLAEATRGVGDPAEALRLSGRALSLQERTFGPSHPDTAAIVITRARLLAEAGEYAAARTSALSGETISREHLVLTARTATEAQAIAYASSRVSALNLLTTIAALHSEPNNLDVRDAWGSVILARALVLDEMMSRLKALGRSTDPDLARLMADLRRSEESLARLVVAGPGNNDAVPYPAALETARKDRERAELDLVARSDEYREKLEWSHAGLGGIVAALPPDCALVSFVRYGHLDLATPTGGKPPSLRASTPSYAAFILSTPGAEPVLVPLGEAAKIDGLVTRWRETIVREALAAGHASKSGEATYRRTAEELRHVVWDPIARQLDSAKHVFIVPDGALNLVTFAALPVGEARYLVEEGRTLHYLSAERDLLTPDKVRSRGGLLTLSNPDFDERQLSAALGAARSRAAPVPEEKTAPVFRGSRSACGSFQSMRFEPLPASVQETEEITRIWDHRLNAAHGLRAVTDSTEAAQVFTGTAANETMFKRTASGHRVLHLATHGFFLGGDCESALDSPAANGMSSASGGVTRENPLLLSGLVLAGANHRESAGPDEDDGILTAQEIATLNLQGTEWAVLSACDTGTGEIRAGEGVFGLRRAFQLAGAHTVIMSLWPVEDEATRQWMTALYRHRFVEGKSTAASLNDASLGLLQQRRARGESTHPFYWAGFIAAGAWQ